MSKVSEAKERSAKRVSSQRVKHAKRRIRRERDMDARIAERKQTKKFWSLPIGTEIVTYFDDDFVRRVIITKEMKKFQRFSFMGIPVTA